MTSRRQQQAVQRWMQSDAYQRDVQRYSGALSGGTARPSAELTGGQLASSFYGMGRTAVQIAATAKGGPVAGLASSLIPESTTAGQSDIVRAMQITGGWGDWTGGAGGWLAREMPWTINIGMMGGDPINTAMRQVAIMRAQGVMEVSQQLKEGERLSQSGLKAIRGQLTQNLAAISRGEGEPVKKEDYGDIEEEGVNAVIAKFSSMTGWTGNQKATAFEAKKAVMIMSPK